jgi:hypothetical protein
MDHEVGTWRMAISMLQFLQKSTYKAFGLFTRCSQTWVKRDDHAPKIECAKTTNLKKNQV